MAGTVGGLSYRSRLTVAMVVAALLPLLVLSIALGALSAILRDEADRRLGDAARAVALVAATGQLDGPSATRLSGETGLAIALFDRSGTSRGASASTVAAAPLPDPLPADWPALIHEGGVASAFDVIGSADAPRGYVAVAAPEPFGGALDSLSLILVALVVALALALLMAWVLARVMVQPLGRLSAAVRGLGAGRLDERLSVEGGDELAAVAESHNRLADALAARNRSLALVLEAIAELAPSEGVERLLAAAPAAARRAFGFIDVSIELAPPGGPVPSPLIEDHVPGEAPTFPTQLRAGGRVIGTLWTSIQPTREWGRADQDLLELFALELAAAIRNAQLFAEVERLSETKSEFLRGVSHNLQTPLTSIRAIASQLATQRRADGGPAGADRGLDVIVEQSERLSRLVEQLLIVSRLEAGTLHPQVEVFAPSQLVRRAWESLRPEGDGLVLDDTASDWLAAADRDRVDQVLWALLDNALKYAGPPIEVTVRPSEPEDALPPGEWLVVAIRDHGTGIAESDRAHVFERYGRLSDTIPGTGLGLSVARGLVEAMGGRLWIPATVGEGATFAFSLTAERVVEA
jgi:signal transduction histidine kinase/HAMP domain-containing protein